MKCLQTISINVLLNWIHWPILTARVTDWTDLNLLPGKMNIYFEETYVGQSQLDLSYVEDTLQISLGPDRNIQVKRKKK